MRRSLLGILIALVFLHGALAFVPWMGLWGFNVARFVSPASVWLPWLLAATACVPGVARRLAPLLERLGEALAERSGLVLVAMALASAGLVWILPDRVHWVGDSLIRLGGVRAEMTPQMVSPQALPLDVWLHYTLPKWLVDHDWLDAEGAVRWLGAMDAAGLAALAGAFALSLEAPPAARIATLAVVWLGGYLCLLTGESKAFAEMCLVVVAFATLGIRVLRDRSGLLALGAVLAVALLLHRLALGLFPAFFFVWIAARRGPRPATGPAWGASLAALALPAVTLAFLAPRLWNTISTYDLPRNFLTPEARTGGIGALLGGTRLLDLISALCMLSPLAPAIPWARQQGNRKAFALLLVLAAPFLVAAFLAQPPQGLIRDWDGLAAAGVSLSLLAAWGLGGELKAPRSAWLAVPVAACTLAFTLPWLFHFHDSPRTVERVEAFLREPPERPSGDRARAWDFLGWQYFQREAWEASAAAFDSSSAIGPTPRMLSQWAMAETMRKNYPKARELYRRAVARDSNFTVGWTGVAVAAIWFEDLDDCERAARQLERLAPREPKTIEILQYLASARRARGGTPR